MKKLFFSFFITVLAVNAYAQDTIIKTSGDKVVAKITEITPAEIKYKRFDFQDGPSYIESKSSVKEIHFSNGMVEVITAPQQYVNTAPKTTNTVVGLMPPPQNKKIELWGSRFRYNGYYMHENELHTMLLGTKDKRLINLVGKAKDAKSMQYIGFAGIAFGIASYVFFIKSLLFNSSRSGLYNQTDLTTSGLCLAAAITCPIISGVSKARRNQYNREAVRLYNDNY